MQKITKPIGVLPTDTNTTQGVQKTNYEKTKHPQHLTCLEARKVYNIHLKKA